MRFAFRGCARILATAALFGAVACTDDSGSNSRTPGSTSAIADGALRFEIDGALQTNPGARVEVVLRGPQGAGPVRVWLDGQYLNGALDKSSVEIVDGTGRLTLSAPSAPASFALRARIGNATARLPVSVSASGFAEVRVLPRYDGPRPAKTVVASVFVSRTCAELTSGALEQDGSLRAEGPVGGALVISSVPAFTPIAVIARIERYALACTQVEPIATSKTIEIDLFDRPLLIARTFAIELELQPDAAETQTWNDTVSPVATEWVDAFMGPPAPESEWLLDAMAAAAASASANGGTELEAARLAGSWNGKTTTWLGAHPPTIRARAAAYAQVGTQAPPTPLLVRLGPGSAPGQAQVTPLLLASRSLASGWITAPAPFDWKSDPSDVLSLSGAMSVKPGALLGLGADVGATTSGAPDLPTGIATGIDCAGLAQLLVGAGTSYSGCDANCTGQLCRTAIGDRALAATATVDAAYPPLSLAITSAATPEVGPDADVRSFSGTWTGTVQGVPSPFGLHGSIKGKLE